MIHSAYGVEWPHPDKGYVRLAELPKKGRYGIFVGSNSAEGSESASEILLDTSSEGARDRSLAGLKNAFDTIHDDLITYHKGHLVAGTAISLELNEDRSHGNMHWVHVGGRSALYLFDHTSGGELTKLSRYEGVPASLTSGEGVADTHKLLGSVGRQLKQWGTIALPGESTIALLTEGVSGNGSLALDRIDDETLFTILGEDTHGSMSAKANNLVDALSAVNEDTAAIVIELGT